MTVVIDTISQPRPRHPEKANRPDSPILRKPDWIRVKAPVSQGLCRDPGDRARATSCVTVCEEAGCPNIGECWDKKHATFMIMGDTCTRACAFCNVKTGHARRARRATSRRTSARRSPSSGLAHVVITSVDRDDLADGGARAFRATHRAIRDALPDDHDRDPDAGFPAQGRRARASWSRRSPTCSTTISKPCRRSI